MGFLAPASTIVASSMSAAMDPPPPPDIVRWATENIVFDERSPLPGPFSIEKFPFLSEILDCLSPEHPAREVTLRGDAQWGKTTSVIQPTLGQWFEHGPLDALVVHPTTSAASEWARRKWLPFRKQAPSLRRMFGTGGGTQTDTLSDQESVDLTRSLKIASAGSPSDLTGTTRKLVVMDDIAKFESSQYGDPEAMAESRAAGFDEAKILRVSTAMLKGTCRITTALERSDHRLYNVPCPFCGTPAPLTWENFKRSIHPEQPHAAHFTCDACNEALHHKHKTEMVARGLWMPTNQRGDHPGFHLWGRAYAPQRDWASIAIDYCKAYGLNRLEVSTATKADLQRQSTDARPEQVFFNDVLGLPFEQATNAPGWEGIRNRVELADPADQYDMGRIPPGAALLTAGVDCQEDRTEVKVKGFGRNRQSWTVTTRVIPHKIDTVEAQAGLDALLKETWATTKGRRFSIGKLAIDEGAFTNDVRAWAYKHPWGRVICVKGARSQIGPDYQLQKWKWRKDGSTRKSRQKRHYMVNVSRLKAEFYGHLAVETPGLRGWCGFPVGLGDEYYRQITSETQIQKRNSAGVMESKWDLVDPTRRNEMLDCEIYARVCAIQLGWYANTEEQWDDLDVLWGAPPEEAQTSLFGPEPDMPQKTPETTATPAHATAAAKKPAPGRSLKDILP